MTDGPRPRLRSRVGRAWADLPLAAKGRLQTGPRTAGVPVAILSADARPGLVQRLLDQGARAFLTKPLDVRELLELLDGVAADREWAGRA